MGQYHHVVSLGRHEYLDTFELGCGLKMLEQSLTPGAVRAALVAFLSRNPGNGPADLGYSPLVGRWAGNRVLAIGDYAEDGDLPGYAGEVPYKELYAACSEKPKRPKGGFRYLEAGENETQAILRTKREHKEALKEWAEYTRKTRPLRNVALKVRGLIESACNVRYKATSWGGWDFIPVKAMAELGADGVPRYVPLQLHDKEAMGFYLRSGFTDSDWGRAPADLQHHGCRDGEIDLGQERVIANLDKREFLDPRAFGEVPTTAGVMRGEDSTCSAAALMFSLFHPERRGGGDADAEDMPFIGRWRGDRLVLTAEHEKPGSRFPTTEAAKARFTDLSATVAKQLAAWDAWDRDRSLPRPREAA